MTRPSDDDRHDRSESVNRTPAATPGPPPRGGRQRLWAIASLLLLVVAVGVAVAATVIGFPSGTPVLVAAALGLLALWFSVQRRGTWRIGLAVAAVVLFAVAVIITVTQGHLLLDVLVLAAGGATLWAARGAFTAPVRLPHAAAPRHPVLFYNPLSGGGKAQRLHLAEEARRRGIEPVELRRGEDLEQLVCRALDRGADALAMAGGDGSQAIVAQVAAEHDLPCACIPAGTRNHFALDLGVDRDDVVGALDAFVDGGERRVDLAEVNGRVFVNNVSLGLYADAVQRAGYREAKIRTLLAVVPESIGPEAEAPELYWRGPEGTESGVAILVSNGAYRLGRVLASGTRPRLDEGRLGISVFVPYRQGRTGGAWRPPTVEQWSEREFDVRARRPVPAGIDGEAVVLDPPLRFRSRPAALRVRVAPSHPGASPSARLPSSPWMTLVALARIALGAQPTGG